jgi:hypothetical protein
MIHPMIRLEVTNCWLHRLSSIEPTFDSRLAVSGIIQLQVRLATTGARLLLAPYFCLWHRALP